jgi:hypothetical protein
MCIKCKLYKKWNLSYLPWHCAYSFVMLLDLLWCLYHILFSFIKVNILISLKIYVMESEDYLSRCLDSFRSLCLICLSMKDWCLFSVCRFACLLIMNTWVCVRVGVGNKQNIFYFLFYARFRLLSLCLRENVFSSWLPLYLLRIYNLFYLCPCIFANNTLRSIFLMDIFSLFYWLALAPRHVHCFGFTMLFSGFHLYFFTDVCVH